MVNELRELMREASGNPPQDHGDVPALLQRGRRRVRVRRVVAIGGTSLAAGAIALGSVAWLNPSPADLAAAGVPDVTGPSVRLADARPAVDGQDYRELASHTDEDLNHDNGQYFDGVTDDGLILFRDGPRMGQLYPRYALMDPSTGKKEWLPQLDIGQTQTRAIELNEERLVLVSLGKAVVYVFDRDTGRWSGLTWPELPQTAETWGSALGPDGRLYLRVPATHGSPPPGGWPIGPGGEADDADAEGETFDLWSVSLDDPQDIRDEQLRVGSIGFTDDSMVWTDSDNGAAEKVHVRDLTTGEETSFDPELGERCNLLGFSVAADRIAMSQYCGTYEGEVRDDRVQVVTISGYQVMTVQDSGVDGGVLNQAGDLLTVTVHARATGGTYVYDFDAGRLLRLSEDTSSWEVGTGPTPGDQVLWTTPAGGRDATFGRNGAEVHLGELIR